MKITKEEILQFLQDEGLLFNYIEDENIKGELEIKGVALNSISNIKERLEKERVDYKKLIKILKRKIKQNEGGVYFKNLDEVYLEDKNISFEKDCFFIDCRHLIITNNTFSTKGTIYLL